MLALREGEKAHLKEELIIFPKREKNLAKPKALSRKAEAEILQRQQEVVAAQAKSKWAVAMGVPVQEKK